MYELHKHDEDCELCAHCNGTGVEPFEADSCQMCEGTGDEPA